MKPSSKILAVIPARGGSKGIPQKNLTLIKDKPLISYTIEAAKKSKYITHFIVSTDDEKIAKVSKKYGADIPFMRPSSLATDDALTLSVVQHALVEMEKIKNIKYDYTLLLQPTSPFRSSSDIDDSIEIIVNSPFDSLVSVVDVEGYHPFRMKRIVGKDKLINLIDQGFEDMQPNRLF